MEHSLIESSVIIRTVVATYIIVIIRIVEMLITFESIEMDLITIDMMMTMTILVIMIIIMINVVFIIQIIVVIIMAIITIISLSI